MKRNITLTALLIILCLSLISCEARDKSRTQNNRLRAVPTPNVPAPQYIPPNPPDTFAFNHIPRIGDSVPTWILDSLGANRRLIMTGRDQSSPMFFANISGRTCVVGYGKDSLVDFLSIYDSEFVTDEGISKGAHLRDVIKAAGATDLQRDSGFAYYLPLKSGWNAAFTIENFAEGTITADSTVSYFFRAPQPKEQ